MSGWQPIETAPKDRGRAIILSDGDEVEVGEWDVEGVWYASTGVRNVWYGPEGYGGLERVDFTPTHWMPFPPPPTAPNVMLKALDFTAMLAEQDRLEALPVQDPENPYGFIRDDEHAGWDIWWGGYEYFVEDSRLETPSLLLGWVHHLGSKGWEDMTPDRISEFVEAVSTRNGWSLSF